MANEITQVVMAASMKKSKLLWIVIACGLILSCGKNVTEQEYLERAKHLQDNGDVRSSVIELKNALQVNPDSVEARWLLGKAQLELGNGAAAEKELTRARELGMAHEAIVVKLGQALEMQGLHDRVIKEIVPVAGLSDQELARLHALRSEAYLGQNQLDNASREIQKALEIKPDSVIANLDAARIELAKGANNKARDWVSKTLAAEPESGEAWGFLGDLEHLIGNLDAAAAAYDKAIKFKRNNDAYHMGRALALIDQGKYEEARKDIDAVSANVPNHPQVSYASGLIHFQQKRYAEAQTAFENAVKFGPDYLPAIFYLGATHFSQGHFEQAQEQLTRVHEANPGSLQAGILLGATRMRLGNFAGAQAVLKPIVERNPDNVVALNLLGNVYAAQGLTDDAGAMFRKVVDLDPSGAVPRTQLGLNLVMQGQQEQGIKEFRNAIDLDPSSQQPQVMLVLTALQAKKFDEAVVAAKRFEESFPKDPLGPNLRGLALLASSKEADARAAFEKALQLEASYPAAELNLAFMAFRKGDLDDARSHYKSLLSKHPENETALLKLASLDASQGRIKEAKEWLDQAAGANPKSLQPQISLARLQLQTGQPSQALASLQEMRSLYPKDPSLLQVVGEAQLAANDPVNAVATFEVLAAVQPRNATTRYLLAKAYEMTGNSAKSSEELDESLRLDSNHTLSKIAKTRQLVAQGKMTEANKFLRELKGAQLNNPEILALEGWVAMKQNRFMDAVAAYEKAKTVQQNSQLTVNLALAQIRAHGPEVGIATLIDWLQRNPKDVYVRTNLANIYLLSNQTEKARTEFEGVVTSGAEDPSVLNNLAWLTKDVNVRQSQKYAEKALALKPDSPIVKDTLGMILLQQNKTEQGLRLITEAHRALPNNMDVKYHLALAYQKSGKIENARQTLKELIETQKPFAERDQALALFRSLNGDKGS